MSQIALPPAGYSYVLVPQSAPKAMPEHAPAVVSSPAPVVIQPVAKESPAPVLSVAPSADQFVPVVVQQTPPSAPVAPAASPVATPGTYHGIQNYGVQSNLPLGERREFQPEEVRQIKQGLRQMWPKLGAGFSTPWHQMLASPFWSGAFGGVTTGVLGSFLVATMADALSATKRGAMRLLVAGAVIGGVFGGVSSYFARQRKNENYIDIAQRMAPGATKRDIESDPAIQKEMDRAAMRSSGGGTGDFLTGMLLAQGMGGSRSSRR